MDWTTQVAFLEQAVADPDPEMAAMAKEDLEGARYVYTHAHADACS